MQRIRITFVIDSFSTGAGTENQLRGLLKNLDPDRVDARLFVLRGPLEDATVADIPWPVESLELHRLASRHTVSVLYRLIKTLRRERTDILMIYFVDSNFIALPAAIFVPHCRAIINRRNMGYYYSHRIVRMLRLFDKLAHHCLVNSQAVKEMVIQKERVPESNITIIPNGLWNTTDAVTPTTREQAGLDESSQVVGVVANLRPVKRIDRFLQVASNILSKKRDTQFLILGQGELEDELRSMAKRLNIKGQVVFAGSVSDVRSHLSLIDVGVLTSESEGLSNSLIEYAVAGLPAVAFDVGGNKEVIIHNETGFLIPDGDVGAMSDCVCRLLTDANLHNHVSQRAREHANATFSSSRILELYMRFFSEYA